MKLLLSQKNELFEEISNSNLSPSQFSYLEGPPTFILHPTTNFYFKFGASDRYFCICELSPAEQQISERYICESWAEAINFFSDWLGYFKRETEIEDKWVRLQKEVESVSIPFADDDSKFSVSEFNILENKFKTLKNEFKKLKLEGNQITAINSKLDYLLSAAKHMNKFDWKSLFIGTFVSLIMQLSVTHEQGIEIWKIIKLVFTDYLLP